MAFTYIRVTRTYELASDVPATGSVRFRPVDRMVNGLTVVSSPVTATLDGSGTIDVRLAATTDPATRPIGVTYEVREQITGQTPVVYYVSVPHTAPGAAVDLATLSVISPVDAGAFSLVDAADYDDTTPPANGNAMVWSGASSKWHPGAAVAGVVTVNGESPDGAGNLVLSPSDVGAQPADADLTGLGGLGDGYPKRAAGTWAAQTASQLATDLGVSNTTPVTLTASGGTITPNASAGWYFQHTAAANVALAVPTGGSSGQLIVVDVLASGADRVLTFPAGTSPSTVTITSGTWHPVGLRNRSGTWFVVDPEAGVGVSGGSGGGGIPADGSVTNVKVSSSAAISADKLVDGSSNKLMTTAERTKLAGLPATPIAQTLVDAKGDLIVGTANDAITRLAAGTNGQVLTANSATATGLSWAALTGGGNYTLPIVNAAASPYNMSPTNTAAQNTTAITNALAAAQTVMIPAGDYPINPFTVPFNAHLIGEFANSYTGAPDTGTRLTHATAATTGILITMLNKSKATNIALVGGGKGSAAHAGFGLTSATLEGVTVSGCQDGIGGMYGGAWIDHCQIHTNRQTGIRNLVDSQIRGCSINDNGGPGIYFQSGANDNIVTDCKLEWNSEEGIIFDATHHCILSNNIIDRNGLAGVWARNNEHLVITGNVLRRNGRAAAASAVDDCHFFYQGNTDSVVTGNTTMHGPDDDATGYDSPLNSIRETGGTNNIWVANNLNGSTSVTKRVIVSAGTGIVYTANIG